MSRKIQVLVTKMVEMDDFKNGCDSTTCQDFGIIEKIEAETLLEALEKIKSSYGTPMHFDDRLELQILENADGEIASSSEMQKFEAGEINLWAASYSFYFSEITIEKIQGETLRESFPNLEDNN